VKLMPKEPYMTNATFFETQANPALAYTEAEQAERRALGLPPASPAPRGLIDPSPFLGRPVVKKRAIRAPEVLNEAPDYPQPVAFSRGLRVDLDGGLTHLFISGTASVGPRGETLHPGDLRAQCWRTYRNISQLLTSEGATWHDVVRCTCYLRDIERDYADFNAIRTEFFSALGLDPLPASTGIQVRLCRSDLLVEIEAHAILEHRDAAP
jgi:2-iminobutanoate/2-iminopropanoate deaminase